MLTFPATWVTLSIVLACVWIVINRRTISQDELDELYKQAYDEAHGLRMFIDRNGKIVKLDETEHKISGN
jgi:hypothetical protein